MGRVAKRLTSMLEDLGFRDVVLVPARGYWRTDHRAPVVRWEGHGASVLGLPCNFSSWNTMTECVRKGIVLDKEVGGASFFEVSAREEG
jgi:hypothetical protein